ncbi:MAG: hypothetical protein NTX61_13060 [Bacteroidetes bacterium]|nr:hypothetical protein [Bacteroidota bacterium]
MKINKIFLLYTFAVLIFAFYLFFANYIFNVIFKSANEAQQTNISLPSETQNIKCGLEKVKIEKLNWKDVLSIKGWGFKQNLKKQKKELYLVLKSKKSTLIFKVKNDKKERVDVTDYFHLERSVNDHGFEICFPLYLLKENTYQVGFVVYDESGKDFSMTSKALSISEHTATLFDSGSEQDLEIKSTPVSIKLNNPTSSVNNNLETVNLSDNNLTINGWGYLKGMNTDFLKSYILLNKNEKVNAFSVRVKIRKDVTDYFKESGLNLDSSGFHAHISTEKLEKGKYRLGLYIVKGDQIGMAYSDKYIDIGK